MSDALVSREAFSQAPVEEVARHAPATVIYSAGGSRRRAALEGMPAQGQDYARWAHERLLKLISLLFRYQVRHLFVPVLLPNQFNEVSAEYRDQMLSWTAWGLGSDQMLATYQQAGWRTRLLGVDQLAPLQQTAERLRAETDPQAPQTLWWYLVAEADLQWQWVLAAAQQAQAKTRSEAIRALYGEDIPPATMLLSFGKPWINHDLLPPLLVGDLQCYWTQKPGYSLSETDLRHILYDYAFLRPTWQADKTGRGAAALEQRTAWEHGPILGLGTRLGPFWYPEPGQHSLPADD